MAWETIMNGISIAFISSTFSPAGAEKLGMLYSEMIRAHCDDSSAAAMFSAESTRSWVGS